MKTMQEAVAEFLALKRIAVAGVSGTKKDAANFIYEKLKTSGYAVFPVNPNAPEVEGDRCYPNLGAVAGGVDGVVIATAPAVTASVIRECADLGIRYAWIHRSIGNGSHSQEALSLAAKHNITVIPSGCPMMYCQPVDFGHKCMRWIFSRTGRIPGKIDLVESAR